MTKKPQPMSMAEACIKFGGDPTANMLPTFSTGQEYQKGKPGGKCFRDVDESRAEQTDWRSGGKAGGGFQSGKGSGEETAADKSDDWRTRDPPNMRAIAGFGGGGGGGKGGGGFQSGKGSGEETAADKSDDWRARDPPNMRVIASFGGGGGGGERPRLILKPRTIKDDQTATPSATSGAYIHPQKRTEMEEQARKRQEKERMEREREEEERNAKDEASQREKDQKEKEEQAKLEKRTKKQAEKDAAKKNARAAMFERRAKGKENLIVNVDIGINDEKLNAFGEECTKLIQDCAAPKVDGVTDMLGDTEFRSIQPVSRLMEPLLRNCRGKDDKYVFDTVRRVAPLLQLLIDRADDHRFKVKVLVETQRLASIMGLPRLSPKTSLLEAVFDGFYRTDTIEEQYYEWWSVADDDTPGKMNAMFQVAPFLDWLRHAHREGDESSESENKEGEEEEDDEDEVDDGSDIEANVPKRAFAVR